MEPFSPPSAVGGAGGGPWKANALRYLRTGVLPKGCVMTTTLNWCEGGSDSFVAFPAGKVPALLSL